MRRILRKVFIFLHRGKRAGGVFNQVPGLTVRGSLSGLTGSGGSSEQYDSYSEHRS